MFCSGCGHEIPAGQLVCPQCGRQIAPPIPPVPGLQFQLESYAGKIRLVSILWFVYAGLSFLFGLAGLTFARTFFMGGFGPWANGPWAHGSMPPFWMAPALFHFIWVLLVLRIALALAAGYGLMQHAQWGRLLAIVAAIFSLIRFPFGTAIGIWTLVVLLGYQNSTLYDQL